MFLLSYEIPRHNILMALLTTKANLSQPELDGLSQDAACSAVPVIYSVNELTGETPTVVFSRFPRWPWTIMSGPVMKLQQNLPPTSFPSSRAVLGNQIGMPKTLYDVN